VGEVVAFAFGLAAASFFPAIVLGIFSMRVGTWPAVVGMVAGLGFTATYIVGDVFFDMPLWLLGIKATGIGVVGMLLNLAVTLGLTPLFAPPSEQVRRLIESVREPEGAGPAAYIDTAPEH
jgi:cation/acetate symporter